MYNDWQYSTFVLYTHCSKKTHPQRGNCTVSKIAQEFVRNVLRQNPNANNFGKIYDAMSRAACNRSFHNLGHEELALAGISFSLLNINKLEHLITEVQQSMLLEDENCQVH